MDTEKKYLTEKEVSAIYSITVRTLQSWRRRGVGPPYVKPEGKLVRYSAYSVAHWFDRLVVHH